MSEISVQFKTTLNGYSKKEVDAFLKDEIEVRLQQKSKQIADLQKQVSELEARVETLTGGDLAVEEKVVLYDRLMKKMDGDYENLLKPAIAKAQAIERKAQAEYEIRMDQAERSAKEIYEKTVEQIGGIIEDAMQIDLRNLENRLERYVYSKTVTGRIEHLFKKCESTVKEVKKQLQTVVQKSKKPAGKCSCRYGKAK